MAKVIFFVHGRSFKLPKAKLKKLWFDAVEAGELAYAAPEELQRRVEQEFAKYR